MEVAGSGWACSASAWGPVYHARPTLSIEEAGLRRREPWITILAGGDPRHAGCHSRESKESAARSIGSPATHARSGAHAAPLQEQGTSHSPHQEDPNGESPQGSDLFSWGSS